MQSPITDPASRLTSNSEVRVMVGPMQRMQQLCCMAAGCYAHQVKYLNFQQFQSFFILTEIHSKKKYRIYAIIRKR